MSIPCGLYDNLFGLDGKILRKRKGWRLVDNLYGVVSGVYLCYTLTVCPHRLVA